MDKTLIRTLMKEKRLKMNQETFSLYNDAIFQKVISHPKIQSSEIIGCYVSLSQEVQTLKIIEQLIKTKRICVPKVEGHVMHFYEIHSLDELSEGHFHVLEPITSQKIWPYDIDCMLVPMLAFDRELQRVGYGKGYYDKYFASDYHGYKLGLAFSYQFVEQIKRNQYDYHLDEIITENKTYTL